jgi:hypothetical protein
LGDDDDDDGENSSIAPVDRRLLGNIAWAMMQEKS